MPRDQILGVDGIPIHSTQDFGADVLRMPYFERRSGDCLFPCGLTVGEPEIGIEKMSARTQHAFDLRQKSRKIWITVGRLDIDDRIERVGFKWQVFRVALHEIQPVNVVMLFAKTDSGGIQVEGGVTFRLKRACKI